MEPLVRTGVGDDTIRLFRFVNANQATLPVATMCRLLEVSESGFYAWRTRGLTQVMAYETLSETDFGISPVERAFAPNVFVDISAQMERKEQILSLFESELAAFPFPRSLEAVRALAKVRGAASSYAAAESFMLLRQRIA